MINNGIYQGLIVVVIYLRCVLCWTPDFESKMDTPPAQANVACTARVPWTVEIETDRRRK